MEDVVHVEHLVKLRLSHIIADPVGDFLASGGISSINFLVTSGNGSSTGSGLSASSSRLVESDKVLLVEDRINEYGWSLVGGLDRLSDCDHVNCLVRRGSCDESTVYFLDSSDWHIGESLTTSLMDDDLVEVALVNVIGVELGEAGCVLGNEPLGELLLVLVELLELVTGLEFVVFSELECVVHLVVLLGRGCLWFRKISLACGHVQVDRV